MSQSAVNAVAYAKPVEDSVREMIAGVIALTTVGSAVVIPILLALFHFT